MRHFVRNSQVQTVKVEQPHKHRDAGIYKRGPSSESTIQSILFTHNDTTTQSHNHSNSPAPSDSENMPVLSMDTSRADVLKVSDVQARPGLKAMAMAWL